MGGGDSRPREDRSGEYEPREPDGQQGPITGSTSAEGDAVQTEISAYTREGNPDDDGPVPEFSRAGDDEGDDNGGYDRLTEILSEDEDGDEEEGEGDDEGGEEGDGDDEVDFEEVRERLGVDEDDREDPSERADDGEDRLREILSEDEAEDGEDSEDGDDSEAEDGEDGEGDRSDDDGDSEEGPETEVEPSQSRVRRMAAMATVWSGAQTGTAAVETGERRADRVAELVARRAEDEATNPEE